MERMEPPCLWPRISDSHLIVDIGWIQLDFSAKVHDNHTVSVVIMNFCREIRLNQMIFLWLQNNGFRWSGVFWWLGKENIPFRSILQFNALNRAMFKSIHLFRKTESDVSIRAKMAGTKNYLLDACHDCVPQWDSRLVWILNVDNGRDRPAVRRTCPLKGPLKGPFGLWRYLPWLGVTGMLHPSGSSPPKDILTYPTLSYFILKYP